MRLYRFRKFDRACTEIQNHTFRFSDRKSLNDPIEGYVKLYWQGDIVAWEGLFGNYIHSLYAKLLEVIISKKDISVENVILLDVNEDNEQFRNALKIIEDIFLDLDEVKRIITYYSENNIRCSKKELKYLLNCFHKRAFDICVDDLISRRILQSEMKEQDIRRDGMPTMEEVCVQLCNFKEEERLTLLETIGRAWDDLTDQMLWKVYQNFDVLRKNWFTIRFKFPKLYMECLEELIYPENYVVCFSKSAKNSSMWGNYADDHKGICMIFETKEKSNKHYLSINKPYCYSSNGTEYKFIDMEVKPIKYENQSIQTNFFTSMGRLNGKQLARFLVDKEQKKSICWNEYFGKENEQWSKEYWKKCETRFCKKMEDWKHEEEYRLLLSDSFSEFSKPESRTLEFDFFQLKGIIFGMKISNNDKFQMIELIKKECEKVKRKEFLFYQAEYSEKDNCMEIRRMVSA